MWWVGIAAAADLATTLQQVAPHRASRAVAAPVIPPEAYARAEAGEVATGIRADRTWGVAVVDVGIDRFWAAINDDLSKPDYSDLAHAAVLQGAPCGADRVVYQHLDVSVLADRWWVVRARQNGALADRSGGRVRELSWASLPDPESLLDAQTAAWAANAEVVGWTEGAWLLVDLGDGRTLVEYTAGSKPGGPLPQSVLNSFAARAVPGTIESMKRLAEAGPRCL